MKTMTAREAFEISRRNSKLAEKAHDAAILASVQERQRHIKEAREQIDTFNTILQEKVSQASKQGIYDAKGQLNDVRLSVEDHIYNHISKRWTTLGYTVSRPKKLQLGGESRHLCFLYVKLDWRRPKG